MASTAAHWRLPTEEAARIALRTQQIVAYRDPAWRKQWIQVAGSYYIESLTADIERDARAYMEKIDSFGGMLAAIERGYVQQEIQKAAYDFQKQVDSSEQIIVGVNRFLIENEKEIPIQHIDEKLERAQIERVRCPARPGAIPRQRASLDRIILARRGAAII